ncbi:LamG-like jellyroll fold domain-containing protein [Actinoplanes sp. NBRC 103695]|uniref:LamG-like jellyroll fold domain-containing protein n=1 Tax=Actinoplanes sp. NBRC 103695 TaxID=3032202 RepID=UPI0024A53255|nr:LamG-like jellyroll fold domain-containing protein [Actinoplanes sp. NBRC 103695]GLY94136.1 hypothetical protein Acsp02_13920 [Actinoplanes sp. NBRC 103695]
MRRTTALAVTSVLLASLVQGVASGVAEAEDKPGRSPAAIAKATGKRVELPEAGSPTEFVYVNPDGTSTVEAKVLPQRVRRGQGWVPVDTKLRVDGKSLAPEAGVVPVAFSGGGTEPLVRLGDAAKQLTLTWPGQLPAPTVEGDTATYSEVMPGVDLKMTARASGYSKVLVIKNRKAAANPELGRLKLGVKTKGLKLTTGKDQTITAVDDKGRPVFQSAAPKLWDTGRAASPAKQDRAPVEDSKRAIGSVEVTPRQIAVVADQKLLKDPATRYPVYLDPDFNTPMDGWALVYEQHPNDNYWGGDGDNIAKVGYSNWEWPTVKIRSYFQFNVSALQGKQILSAELNTRETYSPSCTKRTVELYHTGAISRSTTWNQQPGAWWAGSKDVAQGYNSSCPSAWLGWNVTGQVQHGLNQGDRTQTFMLKAANEGDNLSWKKFDPNATLIVNYNSLPNQPYWMSTDPNIACVDHPDDRAITTTTPTLRATVSDPEGSDVAAEFQWWKNGQMVGNVVKARQHSGTEFTAQIPPGTFADGDRISWWARGKDDTADGPFSQPCYLVFDQTPPNKEPAVSSGAFPEDGVGGPVGKPGLFSFSANGLGDVAGFYYDLDNDQPKTYVAADRPGGTATVNITPLTDKPTDLYVVSVDRAGNIGTVTRRYHFRAGPSTPPVAHWKLDGWDTSRTATDSSGARHDGTLPDKGVAWTGGRIGDALRFDGGSWVGTAGGSTVRTDQSFTVSAWARLDAVDGWSREVVSQDGGRVSGFFLGYDGDARKWRFQMPKTGKDDDTFDGVAAGAAPVQGAWTHLAGSYDASRQEIRFYVNGQLQGSAKKTTAWHGDGAVQFGRAWWNGNPTNGFLGAIDDVKAFDRVLSDGRVNPGDRPDPESEIYELASLSTKREALWQLNDNASDASGQDRHGAPTGGVTWTTAPNGGRAAQFDGTTGSIGTAAPVVRTDNSFTVTTKVRATVLDAAKHTAVSQEGTRTSGFQLGYRTEGGQKKWAFSVATSDVDSPDVVTAVSGTPVRTEWAHLAGVYDAAAGEIRLYVNGQPEGRASVKLGWNAGGAFQLGKGEAGYWAGTIDYGSVHTGVLRQAAIEAESGTPPADPRSAFIGLSRYRGFNGEHITTTGVVPDGFHREGSLGHFAPAGAANTRMLYSCLAGIDHFASVAADCEGKTKLADLGVVYTAKPADVPTLTLSTCVVGTERFESVQSDCEGQQVLWQLGYVRAYQPLVRYNDHNRPAQHWTTVRSEPSGYRAEGTLGLVPSVDVPGAVALYGCFDGREEFSSTDAACEGKTSIGKVGRIFTDPPAGQESRPLYRCRTTDSNESFDSTSPHCEGQTVDKLLGHVLPPV